MTLILNQQNAKVFLREIIDIFQNVKAFFHHKKNHKTGQISKISNYFLSDHHQLQ